MLEVLIEPNSSDADALYQKALFHGAEIRPLTVTTENVASLFFKGKIDSIEFLLAATQVPSFPHFLNDRRSNVSVYNDAKGLQNYFQQAYGSVLKNGKKVDFTNLNSNLTVLFGRKDGIISSETLT